MIKATGFIVYQSGYAVFGIGQTLNAAKFHALQWLERFTIEELKDLPRGGNGERDGELYFLPATASLIGRVKENGGNTTFTSCNGIACTPEEADE
jgi:hypothetical protein